MFNRVICLAPLATALFVVHQLNAMEARVGPAPPRPCPQAECGAPAWRPEIYSLVPNNVSSFSEVVSFFNRDLTPIPDSIFKVHTYNSTNDIPDIVQSIARNPRTGGIAVYLRDDDKLSLIRLLLAQEQYFPAAVFQQSDKQYSYSMVNGFSDIRGGTSSTDPRYIGEDARNAFVEWWGEWKHVNLMCCRKAPRSNT